MVTGQERQSISTLDTRNLGDDHTSSGTSPLYCYWNTSLCYMSGYTPILLPYNKEFRPMLVSSIQAKLRQNYLIYTCVFILRFDLLWEGKKKY